MSKNAKVKTEETAQVETTQATTEEPAKKEGKRREKTGNEVYINDINAKLIEPKLNHKNGTAYLNVSIPVPKEVSESGFAHVTMDRVIAKKSTTKFMNLEFKDDNEIDVTVRKDGKSADVKFKPSELAKYKAECDKSYQATLPKRDKQGAEREDAASGVETQAEAQAEAEVAE